jgi:GDPmannose 4,6-dehydratase
LGLIAISLLRRQTQPDEVYNLGAQSHVQVSFQLPVYSAEASGVVRITFSGPFTLCQVVMLQAKSLLLLPLNFVTHQPDSFHHITPYDCMEYNELHWELSSSPLETQYFCVMIQYL